MNCNKNGIKKEGESCSLNNNCIYPNCMIQKQTVYLPVKVQDELPTSKDRFDIEVLFQYKGTLFIGWFNNETKFFSTSNGLSEYYTDIDLWLKEQELFVFTTEQYNEHIKQVIKQALETAAEKATLLEDGNLTYFGRYIVQEGNHYSETEIDISKESITNTFEETFNKFKQ